MTLGLARLALRSPDPYSSEPRCIHNCGNVDIHYLFGISDNKCCSWQGQFSLTCNETFHPPRLLYKGDSQILNISFEASEMHVFSPMSNICYGSFNTVDSDVPLSLDVTGSPFLLLSRY